MPNMAQKASVSGVIRSFPFHLPAQYSFAVGIPPPFTGAAAKKTGFVSLSRRPIHIIVFYLQIEYVLSAARR